jgi:hypothetical protein
VILANDKVTVRNGRFRIERTPEPSVRVHDFTLKCVGFVGEVTHRDASGIEGELCGTGFFVPVPCRSAEMRATGACSVYFVTARHVIADIGEKEVYFLVNDRLGGVTKFEDDHRIGKRWWFHPTDRTADVAVCQVWPHKTADIISLDISQLTTPQKLTAMDIGIGDEVYCTGLFTPVPGTSRNEPILRYGNIAMMPAEQIQTDLGYADVYLMEARSIGGLSGSPVFVRPTVSFQVKDRNDNSRVGFASGLGFFLLGLVHGHWDVKESEINKVFFEHDRKRGVNMGIAIVTPAIKILETIEQPELANMRLRGEKEAVRKMTPGTDSAKAIKEERPFTKEDFETALKKATRKISSDSAK